MDNEAKHQKQVPAEVWGRFQRSESAHKNMMENAPFFLGAVIAGNLAGLPTGMLHFLICLFCANDVAEQIP